MSIFKEKGPLLYFDLDTIILGDLDPLLEIAEKHRFVTAANFNHIEGVASGIMSWNDDMSHLFTSFAKSPKSYMLRYSGGDQDFINDREQSEFIQTLLPNLHSEL